MDLKILLLIIFISLVPEDVFPAEPRLNGDLELLARAISGRPQTRKRGRVVFQAAEGTPLLREKVELKKWNARIEEEEKCAAERISEDIRAVDLNLRNLSLSDEERNEANKQKEALLKQQISFVSDGINAAKFEKGLSTGDIGRYPDGLREACLRAYYRNQFNLCNYKRQTLFSIQGLCEKIGISDRLLRMWRDGRSKDKSLSHGVEIKR